MENMGEKLNKVINGLILYLISGANFVETVYVT